MTPKTKIEALEPIGYLHNMTNSEGVLGSLVLGYELRVGTTHKWPNGQLATVIEVFPLILKGEALAAFKEHV
jgi:hypothetical protein